MTTASASATAPTTTTTTNTNGGGEEEAAAAAVSTIPTSSSNSDSTRYSSEATPLLGCDAPGPGAISASASSVSPPLSSATSCNHPGAGGGTFWQNLTFRWFSPILERGDGKKRLDMDDLGLIPLPDDCSTDCVSSAFRSHWEREMKLPTPSLHRALFRSYGRDFVRAGLLKLGHDLLVFVGPNVLHAMINYLRSPNDPVWHGVALAATVTASQLAMSLCLRHYFFKCYVTGLRIRTAIVVAVYEKALKLSALERQRRTAGEITNLSSIDAQRLQDLTTYLHALWYSPVQISLALYFLFRLLGPSSLGGVAVMLCMVPITKLVAQWMGGMQKKLMKVRDERVELNSEVLAGMKVIKFQAWEDSFQKRILDLRDKELRQLFRYFLGTTTSRVLWTFTPLLVALATFASYVWSGHQLDVASALTALALFEILRFPLAMLPQVINNTVEAAVSLKRIRSFLLCDEHVSPSSAAPSAHDPSCVALRSVTAAYGSSFTANAGSDKQSATNPQLADREWEVSLLRSQLREAERMIRELSGQAPSSSVHDDDYDEAPLCLKRVDLECRPGELVAVVGGVGSGKSSVLAAILGEVQRVSGSLHVDGSLAYHSQIPFIMNATVRDNILFGHVDEPFDADRYDRALDACALRHDLELLPYGDATEIGEKGVTLSGGQKARVALARAVYHNADITLIDDALSAVDAHVAEHLFERAIVGELLSQRGDSSKPRSVILVTNALQFLRSPKVSRIVVLQDGRVVEQGSYSELTRQKKSVFTRILAVITDSGVSSGTSQAQGLEKLILPVVDAKDTNSTNGDRLTPKNPPKTGIVKTMTEEARMTGHVGFSVYMSWARAAGGVYVPFVVLAVYASNESLRVLANWFLTYWSSHGSADNQSHFLGIYAGIGVCVAVGGALSNLMMLSFGLTASRRLFTNLLDAVLHAPMSFFDTTPVGRLINRFSKDMFTLDEQLNYSLAMYLVTLYSVFSTIVVISGVTPVFALCLVPMCLFYVGQQKYFTITYRELKRLDSVNRSPLYALLSESVDGVAVIRSFSAGPSLTRRLVRMLDVQQHAYYLTCAAQSWLAVRLELIGTMIITFACLSAVLEKTVSGADPSFAGLAGLAISYALSVTQSLNWSVRMASDCEANMVAVERINEYAMLECEGAKETPVDRSLPDVWPSSGAIEIIDAQMRYRKGLPLVLKGLSLKIPAGSKIGVVGRTGAGKSTLMVALLRIVELDKGTILIDGQNIRDVGLAKLRSSIACIPQDPVLYSGTVRSNLDPFTDFSDGKLYECLERVGLSTARSSIASSQHSMQSVGRCRVESLDDVVKEGGSNFSVGQRQLLVIARALLHGSTIVIMDEATASVDAETDALITETMRREFSNATVITVAHRLNTIMDCDYILVMSDGIASEFDTPQNLLDKGGLFRDLVRAAARD